MKHISQDVELYLFVIFTIIIIENAAIMNIIIAISAGTFPYLSLSYPTNKPPKSSPAPNNDIIYKAI